jgi:aminocarboxymuconate-semialdehyde decarboxylase
MTRIDVHTHILPPPADWPDLSAKFGYAGWIALEEIASKGVGGCACAKMLRVEQGPDGRAKIGPDGGRVCTFFREIESNCWDPVVRIAEMDRRSTAANVQVLSTVPVMFGYWAKPEHTLELSRWLNEHIAEVCRAHPARFVGLGTIPMNAPALAIREMERCVRDLGMAGVQIGSNVNGRNLGEPEFFEVFAAAQELGACVFVHPWEMLCGPPSQPPAQGAFPSPPVLSSRLAQHWSAWLVGMPAETCLALCSLLFSGVFEKLPRLRIGFAHGGGSFPGTIGRIDHGFHARPDLCQTHTKTPPRGHVRNHDGAAKFYVDSLVHDAVALRVLIELMGPERIMLGSDYPFPLGEDNPGELIATIQHIPEPARSQMLQATAVEFLGRAGARFAPGGRTS